MMLTGIQSNGRGSGRRTGLFRTTFNDRKTTITTSGLYETFNPVTGRGTAEQVFGNGTGVCFDIREPDPFGRHAERVGEFTACN